MKRCIACGVPMETPEDYAMGDTSKDYCRHCARPDGTMQSYEEKKQNFIQFVVRTQGLDERAAEGVVETIMKNLPAWRGLQ